MEEASELLDTHTNSSLPREKWCGHEYLYKFHGFWFTEIYLKTTQKVLENFKPLPKDIILASFPKTGTTWLKALLHSIIHRSKPHEKHQNHLTLNHPQELVPSLETNLYVRDQKPEETIKNPEFISVEDHKNARILATESPCQILGDIENPEIISVEDHKHARILATRIPCQNLGDIENPEFISVEDHKHPRILSTHIPYQILGDVLNSSECKIVYVTRNPKDTLISLWHFVQKSVNIKDDPWELKAAVDQFCNGIVPFGDYYEHVLTYREESMKRPEKVFFVTYEELKENPRNHVRMMAEFLGCPFGEGDEEIDDIVKLCSFESLSNQEVNKSSELPSGFPLPYSSFFRKGEVGDYVNYLDDEMIENINGVTREKFHGNGFLYGI